MFHVQHPSDFRIAASLWISLTSIAVITPFSVNSFIQGRYLIGLLSVAILTSLCVIAAISSRKRYLPLFTLATFVPAVIVTLYMAFPEHGIISALWYYPAILVFFAILPEMQAWISNMTLFVTAIPNAWLVLDPSIAARFTATLFGVGIVTAIFVRVITTQQRKLESLAVTDPLTGLSNRTMLHDALDHAIEQSQRNKSPMTLLAIDLDRFKSINDTFGHDAGDNVLRGIGELLAKRIRRADHVFRLGGEEFIALLYGTGIDDGLRVAEELRTAIEASKLLPDRIVTSSIGVAALRHGENWMEWMKRADENLYRAKATGRNRVAN